MSFLTKTYQRLQENAIQKILKDFHFLRSPKNYSQSKTIGLLIKHIPGTELRPIKAYIDRLEKAGKSVKILVFIDTKEPFESFQYKSFSRTELNWLRIPSGKKVEDFINQSFDVMVSLCKEPCIPIEYIAALSKAHLRVGPLINKTYCYDIMIDAHEKNQGGLIKEIDHYLNRINSKKAIQNAAV